MAGFATAGRPIALTCDSVVVVSYDGVSDGLD
jgi:hypothetical protein